MKHELKCSHNIIMNVRLRDGNNENVNNMLEVRKTKNPPRIIKEKAIR